MVLPEKVTIRRLEAAEWSNQVSADLGQCCSSAQLDYWWQQVAEKRADLLEVCHQLHGHIGSIIVRLEEMNDGLRDLVIGPAGGQLVRAIRYAYDFLFALAQQCGADRVRLHAMDARMESWLSRYDFYRTEVVLCKRIPALAYQEVAHGRR